MNSVGIRELKRDAGAIIRKVREDRKTIDVTHHGNVVAQIVPVETDEERRLRVRQVWERMDRVSEQISAKWSDSVSAVDAVREQRRDL